MTSKSQPAASPTRPRARYYGTWEESLMLRYRRTGDMAARDRLIEHMLPLARTLARRFGGRGEPLDDLEQVASLGLVEAVERFDPRRGVPFPGFAVPTILGELKRHYRDGCWSVHVPRGLQELAYRIPREAAALTTKHGRSPTVTELAGQLGTTAELVIEALQAKESYAALSLDPATSADTRWNTDEVGAEDKRYALIDALGAIGPAVKALPTRERRMLGLRFGAELTQKQIGDELGVSQMHVSRLLARAIDRAHAIAIARSGG